MSNVLQEYLVKLGFSTDDHSFGKLTGIMAAADRAVTTHSGGMVKALIGAQTGIVGVFTSVSAAIIGVVDRVAMADQGYRLLGMRMLMTTDSARKMDLVTKALGADLNQIVWDPELHQRAVMMAGDIDRMTGRLGPGFSDKMKGIRDIRNEFSRLEVATKFLGMSFVSKLFDKLMPGGAKDKIKSFIDWFEDHFDELADKLSTYAVPALKKTWEILKAAGEAGKAFGVAFTNIVGLLSGDQSIQGTSFSFDKLAKSIEHVGDWMKNFFDWITHAETLLAHFASATSLMLSGKWADAGKEFKAGLAELGKGSGAVNQDGKWLAPSGAASYSKESFQSFRERMSTAPTSGWGKWLNKVQDLITKDSYRKSEEDGIRAAWEASEEAKKHTAWLNSRLGKGQFATPKALAPPGASLSQADLIAAIDAAAGKYGVPYSLVRAVAQQESGVDQSKRSKAGALGVMQLMPDTARQLGVDPNDALQNIEGGTRYLGQMLERYHGVTEKALAAYNAGPGRVDKAENLQDLPAETRNYVPSVLRIESQIDQARQAHSAGQPQASAKPTSAPDILGQDWAPVLANMQTAPAPASQVTNHRQNMNVNVGGVYITQPGADAHTIHRAVADGVKEALNSQVRYDLAELSPAYS